MLFVTHYIHITAGADGSDSGAGADDGRHSNNFGRRGGGSSGNHNHNHSVAGFLDPYAASQPVQLFPAF